MTVVVEKTVDAGGFATRYLEAGDADLPTVLLLHDGAWGGSSSVTWAHIIPDLARDYRVLAPDLLGFGGTDKAVYLDRSPYEPRIAHMEAFLVAVDAKGPVSIIGNSFGGSLALRLLSKNTRFPVSRVVSVNGTGGPWRTPLALAELGHWDGTEDDLQRIVELLVADFPGFDEQLAERMRWASEPGHYRAVAAPSMRLPAALAVLRDPDPWPAQLKESVVPILLVTGELDVLLEPDWTRHFTAIRPDIAVVSLECKHEPNIDRPDLLLPVLQSFLAGHKTDREAQEWADGDWNSGDVDGADIADFTEFSTRDDARK